MDGGKAYPPELDPGEGYPLRKAGGLNRGWDSANCETVVYITSTSTDEEGGGGMSKRKKTRRPRRPLTDQQKQAARVLFDTGSITETAAAVGCHRTTVWRWRNTRQFEREYERVHDKWIRDKRRETLKEWHNSAEYKKQKAAQRRLHTVEKRLEEAGNSGDMRAYRQACAAYDKCFNEAYGGVLRAFDRYFSSPKITEPKKRPEPKKYIIEIID